jgi:hypothetical protein
MPIDDSANRDAHRTTVSTASDVGLPGYERSARDRQPSDVHRTL